MPEQAILFPASAPDIERSADISPCGQYRWRLERRWGPGTAACWIMLNPSTADALKDDPTIRRVIAFSKNWGHDAAVVVNLLPCRTAHPLEARDWMAARGGDLADYKNMRAISDASDAATKVVCAWGAAGWVRQKARINIPWLIADKTLFCLGTNADGSPKHPLARGRARVPDNQEPVRYSRA